MKQNFNFFINIRSYQWILFLIILTITYSCSEKKSSYSSKIPSTNKPTFSKTKYFKDMIVTLQGKTTYVDPIPKEESEGIKYFRVYYGPKNRILREEKYDEYGDISHYTKFIYNSKRKIKEKCYSDDNTPIFTRFYNRKEYLTKEQNYTTIGEPVNYTTYSYNEKGLIKTEAHYSLTQILMLSKAFKYDDQNHLTQIDVYNEKKGLMYYTKMAYNKDGILIIIENYSGKNLLNSRTYFDTHGKQQKYELYLNHKVQVSHEYKNGLKLKSKYFRSNGSLKKYQVFTYNKQGIQIKTQTYSSSGTLIGEKSYDFN